MTTLTNCSNCGRVQEYDDSISLNCQHCEEKITLFEDNVEELECL